MCKLTTNHDLVGNISHSDPREITKSKSKASLPGNGPTSPLCQLKGILRDACELSRSNKIHKFIENCTDFFLQNQMLATEETINANR